MAEELYLDAYTETVVVINGVEHIVEGPNAVAANGTLTLLFNADGTAAMVVNTSD